MRILVIALLLFFDMSSYGQTIYQPQGTPKGTNRFLGTLIVDSAFVISGSDTVLLGSYYNSTLLPTEGMIRFKKSNKTYYYWNGNYFKELGGGNGGSIITDYGNSVVLIGSSGTNIVSSAIVNKVVTALIINDNIKNTGFSKILASNTLILLDGSRLVGGEIITLFYK